MNKTFLLLVLALPNLLMAMTCHKGKLRFYSNQKITEEPSQYCTNSDATELISEKCYLQKCYQKISKVQVVGKYIPGNPGFYICEEIGGRPQIVEFLVKDRWFELDRCLLKDGLYLDTGLLYKYNRDQ